MKTSKPNIAAIEQLKESHKRRREAAKRYQREVGYENSQIGALVKEALREKGMTQEEFARKVRTTKSYISKIENNTKEVRISTLQKIVELGLGGHLELSIKL